MGEYLKCDAAGCDHVEDVETITADLIGKPCPKCGASLLTAEDWATWSSVFRPAIEAMKEEGLLDPSAPRGAVGAIRVGYHDGQLTMVTPFNREEQGI